jgi:hypothetical protein
MSGKTQYSVKSNVFKLHAEINMPPKFDDQFAGAPCLCNRCQRDLTLDDYEHQERMEVCFRGGYASVFGDENVVRGTFCQRCFRELLGPWLQVLEDGPDHKIRETKPLGVFQAYQFQTEIPEKTRSSRLRKPD